MDNRLFLLLTLGLLGALAAAPSSMAHEPASEPPLIVIDTDLGLDDVATLTLVLQSPQVHLRAVVACDGACNGRKCADFLRRLLCEFNRPDVILYEPASGDNLADPPPFRSFLQESLQMALPHIVAHHSSTFVPEAYAVRGPKTIVLVLGPLTNLAAALRADPGIKAAISKVIIPGWPDVNRNWNIRYDPESYEVVRRAGMQLVFVAPDEAVVTKPSEWRSGKLEFGPNTAIGEQFLRRLLKPDQVREHYLTKLGFHDELAFLYLVYPYLFKLDEGQDVNVPADGAAIARCFKLLLSEGRQRKARVVFADDPLPASVLRPDVRQRMDRIIARHGHTEWFAQLIMNELHQHLGPYSVIGVKMGLRAAELLNAPQHAMRVVSHVSPNPPVSCLNDGIIAATGCTPGRALFSQSNVDEAAVKATFAYNGRTITLVLKDHYRKQVARKIQALRLISSLEDHLYWTAVRNVGLDIWEKWHRRDLFEVAQ